MNKQTYKRQLIRDTINLGAQSIGNPNVAIILAFGVLPNWRKSFPRTSIDRVMQAYDDGQALELARLSVA